MAEIWVALIPDIMKINLLIVSFLLENRKQSHLLRVWRRVTGETSERRESKIVVSESGRINWFGKCKRIVEHFLKYVEKIYRQTSQCITWIFPAIYLLKVKR